MARRTCTSLSCVNAALLFGFLSPALACGDDESFMFSCVVKAPSEVIEVCGLQEGTTDGLAYSTAHVVYATAAGPQIAFPADPAEGPKKLLFSHLFRNDLYEAQVRFVDGDTQYRLFFRDAPEGSVPQSGLEVYKAGALTQTISCSEAPDAYFDQLRQSLACDLDNPYGAQGCSGYAPVAK